MKFPHDLVFVIIKKSLEEFASFKKAKMPSGMKSLGFWR